MTKNTILTLCGLKQNPAPLPEQNTKANTFHEANNNKSFKSMFAVKSF